MLKPFSQYLKAVEEHLPSEHHQLLRNGLYLALLDWYTDGVEPRDAAARISAAVAGEIWQPSTASIIHRRVTCLIEVAMSGPKQP